MDAVAGFHIAALGVSGGRILQHFGTVEELPVVFLAHLHDGLVVFVHLGLGQAFVGMLLAQRRNGVDDDVHAGIGFLHRLDALFIACNKIVGAVGRAQIVGAEGDDDPPGLHDGHRFGHGLVAGNPLELDAFIGGQGPRRHAHRPDGIIVGAVIEHAIHTRCIGIAQEQSLVHILLTGIIALFQDGGSILGGVNGILVLVVALFIHHCLGPLAVGGVPCRKAEPVHNEECHQ